MSPISSTINVLLVVVHRLNIVCGERAGMNTAGEGRWKFLRKTGESLGGKNTYLG